MTRKTLMERWCSFLSRVFRPDYEKYIRSARWKGKSRAAKERAGWRCQGCNRPQGLVILECHHRTYDRLGFELPGDLTVFCPECHNAVTQVIAWLRSPGRAISFARTYGRAGRDYVKRPLV